MPRFDSSPRTWDEVYAGYSDETVARTKALQRLVVDALPSCTETVAGAKVMGYAQYWYQERNNVVAMNSPEDSHVKLYLHHVRKDETGRLKVEGTGKNARHVKIPLDGPLDDAAIADLLAKALHGAMV